MAAERPPIEARYAAFANGPKPSSLEARYASHKQSPVSSKTEPSTPFWPVKEDIPGIASSALHGVTGGLSDVGREPISKIIAGTPGEYMERGFKTGQELRKNPRRLLTDFAISGPSIPYREALKQPLATPETEVGFPVAPRPKSIVGNLMGLGTEMGASYLQGKGVERAARFLAEKGPKAGVRMVRGMIKPTGEFAERGDEISEALLKEGLVRGGKENILNAIKQRSQELNSRIDDIMTQYENRQISPEKAIKYMDEVKSNYQSDAALDDVINKVDDVKNQIIKKHSLERPIFDVVEESDPMGVSTKSVKEVGKAPNVMGVKKAHGRKQGQYKVSYDSDAMTPERTTRRAYARGLKEAIEEAIPEEPVGDINRRIGDLSEAAQVVAKRTGVSDRNALMNLGDMVLIGTAPKVAVGRKLLGADQMTSAAARALYNAPKRLRSFKDFGRKMAVAQGGRRLLDYTEQ